MQLIMILLNHIVCVCFELHGINFTSMIDSCFELTNCVFQNPLCDYYCCRNHIPSAEKSRKQCDPAAESESKSKSIGVASPPHGPKCLVRPRFSFRTPWDVLPPPWPPPLVLYKYINL